MSPRKNTPTTTEIPQTPRGGLKLRPWIIVLSISLVAGLSAVFVPAAEAVVCPPPTGYKSIGNTCYYVNTVEVNAELKQTGNLQVHPKKFSVTIQPTGEGVLYCKNKPGNQPPGQRIITETTPLQCTKDVDESDVMSMQQGGTAVVVCTAKASPEELERLGMTYCSKGQFAVDYVPCEFYSEVMYTDETDVSSTIEKAKHHCKLDPDVCATLPWDRTTDLPKRVQYPCEGPID